MQYQLKVTFDDFFKASTLVNNSSYISLASTILYKEACLKFEKDKLIFIIIFFSLMNYKLILIMCLLNVFNFENKIQLIFCSIKISKDINQKILKKKKKLYQN